MATASYAGTIMRSDTDAKLRSWAYPIQQAAELGLTQTLDTGQASSFNSLVTPGTNNTKAALGPRLYKSSDGAGLGLNDFIIKFHPGTGGSTNLPSLWVSAGWATDGAGNFTGNSITEVQVTDNTYDTNNTAFDTYGAAGSGWLTIGVNGGNSGAAASGSANSANGAFMNKWIISIERTRNNDGTPRDEIHLYVAGFFTGGTVVYINRVMPRTGSLIPPNANSIARGWNPITDAMAISGSSDKIPGTLLPYGTQGWMLPSLNLIGLDATSYSTNAINHLVPMYGSNHTYRTFAYANNAAIGSANRMLMRYE